MASKKIGFYIQRGVFHKILVSQTLLDVLRKLWKLSVGGGCQQGSTEPPGRGFVSSSNVKCHPESLECKCYSICDADTNGLLIHADGNIIG